MVSPKIFNWRENCAKIIETGKYSTCKHQVQEQRALFECLIAMGKSRKEIYDFWLTTNSKIVESGVGDTEYLEIAFRDLYNKALKFKILNNQKTETILIYQEDIDFINNLMVELWVKKYLLALLCVYRYYGSKDIVFDCEIEHFLFIMAGKKKSGTDGGLSYYKQKIQQVRSEYNLYTFVIAGNYKYVKRYMKLNYDNKGTPDSVVGCISSPEFCDKLFYLLCEEQVACEECGILIGKYSAKQRGRVMCDKCYQKYYNYVRNHVYRKKN